jgi:hypothetical protein
MNINIYRYEYIYICMRYTQITSMETHAKKSEIWLSTSPSGGFQISTCLQQEIVGPLDCACGAETFFPPFSDCRHAVKQASVNHHVRHATEYWVKSSDFPPSKFSFSLYMLDGHKNTNQAPALQPRKLTCHGWPVQGQLLSRQERSVSITTLRLLEHSCSSKSPLHESHLFLFEPPICTNGVLWHTANKLAPRLEQIP